MRNLRLIARAVILSCGLTMMFATAASADTYAGHVGEAPQIAGPQFGAPSVESVSPAPVAGNSASPVQGVQRQQGSGLAFTGADTMESVVIALGAIGLGFAFVRLSRRRSLA